MPLIISDDDAVVGNTATLVDSPAVRITGDRVQLINTESGRIRSDSNASPAILIEGADAVVVNAFGAIIRGMDYDKPAIVGSAFDDTIVNEGLIVGTVSLGEGNDSFTQRAQGTGSLIDLGGGGDTYRIGPGNGYFAQTATGGGGFDTVVLEGVINQLDGTYVTGFERIEIGAGSTNIQNFSGFSEISIGAGASVNMVYMINPDADLSLSGGSATLNGSIVDNVIGTDAAEGVDIGSGGGVLGDVTLGGGNDFLSLSWWGSGPGPAFDGNADGGAGQDQISLNFQDGRTVDLANFVNFETLAVNVFTNNGGDVRVANATGLTLIHSGSSARLVLADSNLPSATVRMFAPFNLVLESGATVWRVGLFDPPWTDPGSVTQADDRLSSTLVNSGSVLGDVRFHAGDDLYDGRSGSVGGIVNGYAGNDRMYGGAGQDRFDGGLGADLLDGGAGADTLTGGGGGDQFWVEDPNDIVLEAAGGGADIVYASVDFELAVGSEVEILSTSWQAGTAPLTLVGNEFANILYGNAGGNLLVGGGGSDVMVGFAGNDTYFVDHAGDRAVESAGEGVDIVYSSISYVLAGGQEIELLSAASNGATTAMDLTGNEQANIIYGNNGVNNLRGGGGNGDRLIGLGGNDVYFIVSGTEQLFEAAGGGADAVYTNLSHALASGQEIEILSAVSNGAATAMDLTGNELANLIYGTNGVNNLRGGGGAGDVLVGFGGDDVYYIVSGSETVIEAAGGGSDVVYTNLSHALAAGQEIEILSAVSNGAATAMDLAGNAFSNQIYANNGANVIDGGGGNDGLWGYGGADSFAFTAALGSGNVDTIVDYQAGLDKFLLDDAAFAGIGPLGALSSGAFAEGPAQDADDRILYFVGTGLLFYDADGSGAGAAVMFATMLGGGVPLSAADFTVI